MNQESSLFDSITRFFKKFIPVSVFNFFAPLYHWKLSWLAALWYGFPSRAMTIIGVTGTKGKSTAVYLITKVLENQGVKVAAVGSIGYKILDHEWPNPYHMTMPGRGKLQKFFYQAKKAGVTHVVLEVTSQGLAQHRLSGVHVDCAVFTNLHPEHIESHGSFEKYKEAKKKLFYKTKGIHIINADDEYAKEFRSIEAREIYMYGWERGSINQNEQQLHLKLAGDFNVYNALAAMSVAQVYKLDLVKAKQTLESIAFVPGRMQYVQHEPFAAIVDYAHTPESLEAAYKAAKEGQSGRLIALLGSDGGGRDVWKRPVFGEIASTYCDEIILTNENPYDADPDMIADDIEKGIIKRDGLVVKRILDRREAMREAAHDAKPGDVIIATGKGSETTIGLARGRTEPWSDTEELEKAIRDRG